VIETVAPAPAGHQATGEFIDDHDLAVLHHVVLVALVEVLGAQRGVDVVHQRDVGRVVQARAFGQQAGHAQNALGVFVALLGEEHLAAFFVEREVADLDHALAGAQIFLADLLLQLRHDSVDAHVHLGVVFGLAADDQRRARFVDQDRIDLIDDGIRQRAL
jgi:hypothetical protein